MKHVTILAVFQFARGKNGASWPRSASRAPSFSFPGCVARQSPEADLFCQSGAHLGVIRSHDRIVPGQVPFLPVLIWCELMIGSQMPP
jgi:hypothetical protein